MYSKLTKFVQELLSVAKKVYFFSYPTHALEFENIMAFNNWVKEKCCGRQTKQEMCVCPCACQ